MQELMTFDKFKRIMDTLIDFQARKDRVADFFEKELMENSWCVFTMGNTLESTLINLLADEFDCWYTFREDIKKFDWWNSEANYGMENDIETWLYTTSEEKAVWIEDKKIDISSLESLYDYLVSSYKQKHNLTD